MWALVQLPHGCFLSHFTLRRRQVVQERGLKAPLAEAEETDGLCMRLLWAVYSAEAVRGTGETWWSGEFEAITLRL